MKRAEAEVVEVIARVAAGNDPNLFDVGKLRCMFGWSPNGNTFCTRPHPHAGRHVQASYGADDFPAASQRATRLVSADASVVVTCTFCGGGIHRLSPADPWRHDDNGRIFCPGTPKRGGRLLPIARPAR